MQPVCFASGNLALLLESDISAAKKILSQLDMDGIEWHYGSRIENRPILDSDISYFKRLKHNSIHSVRIRTSSEEQTLELFKRIELDYEKINARSIVFHPETLPPRKVLDKLSMNFLVENVNCLPFSRSRLGFEEVLKKNKDIDLCLDVAHAYYWSSKETKRIISKWGRRINQVHLSYGNKKRDHLSMSLATKSFLNSIKPLANLNVPIVIEVTFPVCSLEYAQKEIALVKEILNDLV